MISIDYDEFKNMWHVAVKVQVQVLGYEPVNWTKQTYGIATHQKTEIRMSSHFFKIRKPIV